MNEVWCSDAFAPKYVLRKVLSWLQGHYLLESDDGITINRYIWAVSGPGFWFYWMFYDHFSARSLLAKLGRVWARKRYTCISVLLCTVPIFRTGLWHHHAAPLITVWDCHPLSHQSGRGHKRRLLSISDEKEYPWARHVHSRWCIFIHSLSVTSLGY